MLERTASDIASRPTHGEGPPFRATEADRETLRTDGYLLRRDVFSHAEVDQLRGRAEALSARVIREAQSPDGGSEMRMPDGHRLQFSSQTVIQWEWQDGSQEIRLIEPFTHLDQGFARLWGEPRLSDPFKDMLELEDVGPFTCKLNLKRPREGSEFPWHQDFSYWYTFAPETAHRIGTAILFLDDASAENGALRVMPGSHANGAFPRDKQGPDGYIADPALIDESREVLVEAEAGSVLYFSSLLLHRSCPNRSDRQRRAILLSYQAAGLPRRELLPWRPELVEALP